MIDELLADSTYVLHADLRRLIPTAAHTHTPTGSQRAHLLRLTPRAIVADPPERLALLSVTEAFDGLDTAFRHHRRKAPYRGLWANPPPRLERAILEGHTSGVNGVCVVRVDGRELLASVSADRTLRIWDPSTGLPRRVIPIHYEALTLARFNAGCLIVGHSAGLLAVRIT
ncbi:MAG: hypothetical protein ACRDTC_14265 [Pseudonocardiaceae bacterium]